MTARLNHVAAGENSVVPELDIAQVSICLLHAVGRRSPGEEAVVVHPHLAGGRVPGLEHRRAKAKAFDRLGDGVSQDREGAAKRWRESDTDQAAFHCVPTDHNIGCAALHLDPIVAAIADAVALYDAVLVEPPPAYVLRLSPNAVVTADDGVARDEMSAARSRAGVLQPDRVSVAVVRSSELHPPLEP